MLNDDQRDSVFGILGNELIGSWSTFADVIEIV